MKRSIWLGLIFAMVGPLVITGAEAASKKKRKGPQVAGFVQTAPLPGGSLRNQNRFGESKINGYTDYTQQFFARQADKSP
jgi:hypothetical protein